MSELPALAWHYTTGIHFERICATGFLMPAATAVTPPEKPIVWFSLNQYWEPTANKGWAGDGDTYTMTMQETFKRARGLCRFGCPLRLLRGGEALRKEARMKSSMWKLLATEGKRKGADPGEWWGTTRPLAIEILAVAVMNRAWVWEPVRDSVNDRDKK